MKKVSVILCTDQKAENINGYYLIWGRRWELK
jgi:hypothetical protein